MKNTALSPLPPPYQLSSIGDAPVKLALVAAALIRQGISEEQAITDAHRLIGKAENYLVDIEAGLLANSDAATFDIDRLMADMQVKRRSTILGYLKAVKPADADGIWTKALKGERVFSYPLRTDLKLHQASIHKARSEKAAAGRKKTGQR